MAKEAISPVIIEEDMSHLAVIALLAVGAMHACGQGCLVHILPALLGLLLTGFGVLHEQFVRLTHTLGVFTLKIQYYINILDILYILHRCACCPTVDQQGPW